MGRSFIPLKVTAKYPVCNVPLNLDTYKHCQFKCKYCFSYAKRMMTAEKWNWQPSYKWLRNRFEKVYDEKDVDKSNFIECLLKNRITLHGGVTSDCFQPRELKHEHTKKCVEICNEYDQTILFQTKGSSYYNVPVNPKLHSFQLSVSNSESNKYLEPNVPSIEERIDFFNKLKDEGYKIQIRIQPYMPNITDIDDILDKFPNADNYTIGNLFIHSPNTDFTKEMLDLIDLKETEFRIMGSLRLKVGVRQKIYNEFKEKCEERGYHWNVSDVHMHQGTDNCCCGDNVVPNPSNFGNTMLVAKYGENYTLEQALHEYDDYKDCIVKFMYTSNRWYGNETLEDFLRYHFDKPRSPFSPKFQHRNVEVENTHQTDLTDWCKL